MKDEFFKLAHFNPSAKDDYGNQISDYLILDALSAFGFLEVKAKDIRNYIKDTYKLVFEEPEIEASGKRLRDLNKIEYHDISPEERRAGKVPRFKIKPEILEEVQKLQNTTKELEKQVLDEWQQEIFINSEELGIQEIVKENIDSIIENWRKFTGNMLRIHGIQSVAILQPDSEKVQKWLDKLNPDVVSGLVRIHPLVDDFQIVQFKKFFTKQDDKRKIFVNGLFNACFFWHLIQVDKTGSTLLKKVTKGQKLILDTNIIYSLLGLDGEHLLDCSHIALKIAKDLGYDLAITTKTIDEFHESFRRKIKDLPFLPKDLARATAEVLDCDNVIACYWKAFADSGLSIEQFASEKLHIEGLIDELGIRIIKNYRADIEKSNELKREESILRQIAPHGTDEYIIEHDAFHRILIGKFRKSEKYNFSEAIAWFLTDDTKLPAYDKAAQKGKRALPFCMLLGQWIQVNRPFVVRTKDESSYNDSFYLLVSHPFLRSMMQNKGIEKAEKGVIAKLSRLKGMSSDIFAKIIQDAHFLSTYSEEPDEEKQDDLIINRAIMEFSINKKRLTEKSVDLQETVLDLDKTGKKKSERIENLEHMVESLRKEQQQLRKDMEDEIERNKKRDNDAKDRIKKSVTKDSKRDANRIAFFITALSMAVFIALFILKEMNLFKSKANWILLAIIAGFNLVDWTIIRRSTRKYLFKKIIKKRFIESGLEFEEKLIEEHK